MNTTGETYQLRKLVGSQLRSELTTVHNHEIYPAGGKVPVAQSMIHNSDNINSSQTSHPSTPIYVERDPAPTEQLLPPAVNPVTSPLNPQDALPDANPVTQHNLRAKTEDEEMATSDNSEAHEINVQHETNYSAELSSDHRHSNKSAKAQHGCRIM